MKGSVNAETDKSLLLLGVQVTERINAQDGAAAASNITYFSCTYTYKLNVVGSYFSLKDVAHQMVHENNDATVTPLTKCHKTDSFKHDATLPVIYTYDAPKFSSCAETAVCKS